MELRVCNACVSKSEVSVGVELRVCNACVSKSEVSVEVSWSGAARVQCMCE